MSQAVFDGRRRRQLGALADTFVPAVRPPAVEADDPHGFWGRRASDLDLVDGLVEQLGDVLDDDALDALGRLLDLLRVVGFAHLPQSGRETVLRGLAAASSEARDGLDGLRALVAQRFYGQLDDTGRNPNWPQLGYPGPPAVEAPPRHLRSWSPPPDDPAPRLRADAVVVGSGAGGGVIAAELAAAGFEVVILEAAVHREAPDFPPDELTALRQLYWRGGLSPTDDGNVAVLAGAALGGGTTVNWLNCVRPSEQVRRQWASEHGLLGVDGPEFDRHLDAVLGRIGANADASDLNGVNRRLAQGASALGLDWTVATRNAERATYDPELAGHTGFGDRSGNKQSTATTYLRDAQADGARLVCGARVRRVTTRAGAATGVEATVRRPDGRSVDLVVAAPQVVVAAGALETPALLLRSGIGGPAVGRYLRLHPVPMVGGFYDEDLRHWWGPPQATIVTAHTDVVDGFGYLVETPHLHPAVSAAAVPWRSGRDHKLLMGRFAHNGVFIAVTRDHGGGTVTLDAAGEAVVRYPLTDPLDREVRRHAVRTLVELHVAAGARVVFDTDRRLAMWRRGEDLDAFVRARQDAREGAGGRVLFSAHQMGSARMGTDPRASVATPDGQLHDVRGVWIGDTSAFPSAVGANPMLTTMALARRTAGALLATSAAPSAATAATPRGPGLPS
ncbi:GMC family oxidoreductase N-terminal domain-containing protein [Egicoccus halophilus]|uniref:GMC oxidoreductase n=1 Tax=Egicoccus halophilus TaxID=1670830 RepID=A0A8J3A9W8_9ACTN|nr:GMC family oxidoreductase [Egicoccus halophilus]GGI08004.1 GMC oxidoreductase [Egicoccus halophilus]